MQRSWVFLIVSLGTPALVVDHSNSAARGDGIRDLLYPKYKKQEPYKPHLGAHNQPQLTMVQLANVIDIVERDLRQDGTIVIQTPSVWGQARMTVYRRDFEREMVTGLDDFKFILSARVARSDQASLQSETALAASLTPADKNSSITMTPEKIITERDELSKAAAELLKNAMDKDKIEIKEAFSLFTNAFKEVGKEHGLGLEPTIFLDEKKRYLDHLNQIRRINLGDDIADSAGYGLYLVRLPVSIEPGQKTDQGHGATLTATVEHDFGPFFLQRTFRNLVINDLVDQLTPIVFEILEHELDKGFEGGLKKLNDLREQKKKLQELNKTIDNELRKLAPPPGGAKEKHDGEEKKLEQQVAAAQLKQPTEKAKTTKQAITTLHDKKLLLHKIDAPTLEKLSNSAAVQEAVGSLQVDRAVDAKVQVQKLNADLDKAIKALQLAAVPATIVNGKTYPIAPSDKLAVFAPPGAVDDDQPTAMEHFIHFLRNVRAAQHTVRPRATDVRLYLQHELEAAYDIMQRDLGQDAPLARKDILDRIVTSFHRRNYKSSDGTPSLETEHARLIAHSKRLKDAGHQAMGFLCWTIAVDAALLNERLRDDMKRIEGRDGYHCAHDLKDLYFYVPAAGMSVGDYAMASAAFEGYVKARWPLLTFSLDPVVDQQNIADALSIRRDLQLAISFAFASGRIGFNQMMRFHRLISIDAETIALNRTVTSFAHGNDTFGWRFTPRYQNPPSESNPRLIASMLFRTGPGPNYQQNKSKLERGQRELTAVIVMPSFLNSIRMDIRGNWFKLTHPENFTMSSGRMLEQGRFIKELQETDATTVCDAHRYRPEDVRGLQTKLTQLRKMLPMQSASVNVPYENNLGGFDLFVPGTTALVPILVGYDGIDVVGSFPPTEAAASQPAFFLYGKHFSIHETKVVAGGRSVPDTDVEILSREVMRIKVAKDVQATEIKERAGSRKFVEIHVATPNGISNHVLIPMPNAK